MGSPLRDPHAYELTADLLEHSTSAWTAALPSSISAPRCAAPAVSSLEQVQVSEALSVPDARIVRLRLGHLLVGDEQRQWSLNEPQ